jgi:hypothetical protein
MKKTTSFTILCFFISFGSFAQKERFNYQPRLIQASIRAGLVNGSLNLEYRINPKIIASVDFDVGIINLHSNYYNKFNENYTEYNKYFENSLNFGVNGGVLTPLFKQDELSVAAAAQKMNRPLLRWMEFYSFGA